MSDKKVTSIGCVVMAAGNSKRFGENKLTTVFNGKSLIRRTLDAVPQDKLDAVCVVTQYDEIEALSELYGFHTVRNDHPENGISLTVRLGTAALMNKCDAILYLVSDQPFLRRDSISKLIDFFLAHPDNIVSASRNGKRGNPCIFPEKHFAALLRLTGDTGGSAVIRSNEEDLLLFEIGADELFDIDSKEDLESL